MDINVNLIVEMVKPYVQDGCITYETFDQLFKILSLKEQYEVTNVLYNSGINLVDNFSDEYLLDVDEKTTTGNQLIVDDTVFKDKEKIEEEVFLEETIKQSNEILCSLIQKGNRQAKQDLCVKNVGLVQKYALIYDKRYGNRLDIEDLKQAGFIGLIKAAERYEPSQNTAFSTYAVFWVKQSISREIMDHGYAIRIPVHMHDRINKVMMLDNSLAEEGYDFYERLSLISNKLGLEFKEVKECLILKNNYLTYASLNSPIGEDEESELGEFIPDEETFETEEQVFKHLLKEDLEVILQNLSPRENEILMLRFGFVDGDPKTLEDIGKRFNLTRERIRQIEAKALRKLRHPSRSKTIKEYLY